MCISVIIPVYNVAPYLRMCLDSVAVASRNCTSSVECICVDDGSTDGCGKILDEYSANIKVIRQANAGVSAARNRGIDSATGDWVVFVDADDEVRDSTFADIERMQEELPSADLVGYGMMPIEDELGAPDWKMQPLDIRFEDTSCEIGSSFAGMSFCEFAYRRGLLSDIRFPALTVGEDHLFFSAVLGRARECVLTSRKLYGYRYRLNSVTRTEVTCDRLGDLLTSQMEMFRALNASGKKVCPQFVDCRSYGWLEGIPRQLLAWRDRPGTRELWNRWFDSLRQVADCAHFDPWCRRWAARMATGRSRLAVRAYLLVVRMRRRWLRMRIIPHEQSAKCYNNAN